MRLSFSWLFSIRVEVFVPVDRTPLVPPDFSPTVWTPGAHNQSRCSNVDVSTFICLQVDNQGELPDVLALFSGGRAEMPPYVRQL